MDDLFSIVLKSIGTVIIVYALLIPLLKHHNVVSFIDGVFVLVVTILLFVFTNTESYIVFTVIMGVLLLIYLGLKLFWQKDKSEWLLMFHVSTKDYQALVTKFSEMIEKGIIEPDMVVYDQKFPFICRINIKDKIVKKNFLKSLDQLLKTDFAYPFAFRYGLFLVTFIILAMIWRY